MNNQQTAEQLPRLINKDPLSLLLTMTCLPDEIIEENGREKKKAKLDDSTSLLSDEILVEMFVAFSPCARTLAHLKKVNRRFRGIFNDSKILDRVVKARIEADGNTGMKLEESITTLEDLAVYEAIVDAGLFEENRIGFDFASTDVDSDDGEASGIPGSVRRIQTLSDILCRFHDTRVVVEAHCGTAGPTRMAPGFSRARGDAVVSEIVLAVNERFEDVSDRVDVHAWGKRVAHMAARSDHKHGLVAREGRGWVDVFVKKGDLELPSHPEYYEGIEYAEVHSDPYALQIIIWR